MKFPCQVVGPAGFGIVKHGANGNEPKAQLSCGGTNCGGVAQHLRQCHALPQLENTSICSIEKTPS